MFGTPEAWNARSGGVFLLFEASQNEEMLIVTPTCAYAHDSAPRYGSCVLACAGCLTCHLFAGNPTRAGTPGQPAAGPKDLHAVALASNPSPRPRHDRCKTTEGFREKRWAPFRYRTAVHQRTAFHYRTADGWGGSSPSPTPVWVLTFSQHPLEKYDRIGCARQHLFLC